MNWRALGHDIGEGVRAQPARIGLAFVSVALGMTALALLLGLLGGIRQRTQALVGELGVNVFGIVQTRAGSSRDAVQPLTRRHVALLAANLPGATVTGMRIYDGGPAGLPAGTVLVASDANVWRVRPWRIVQGRALDPEDLRTRARHAVVSLALARTLQITVGNYVRLRDVPFVVVGLADGEPGALATRSADAAVAPGERLVFVPETVPACWMPEGEPPASGPEAIFVRPAAAAAFDNTLRQAEALMGEPDAIASPVAWITPRSLRQPLLRHARLIAFAGGAIVLLSLALGGITLASLLLTNLQARIPEIGLRRALGASPADIAALFAGEALLVTVSAALAGIVVAAGLAIPLRLWSTIPVVLHPAALSMPLLSGIVLGFAASYGPARVAARIAPAEALRNE